MANPEAEVRRTKDNFPDPEEGTCLLEIDADKWPLPESPLNIGDKGALRAYLDSYFNKYQLGYLAGRDVLVCFSSSSAVNGGGELIGAFSAHLYMSLDAPMTLEELRAWSHAVNGRVGKKIIDGSVYRSVQHRFLSSPGVRWRRCRSFRLYRRVFWEGQYGEVLPVILSRSNRKEQYLESEPDKT